MTTSNAETRRQAHFQEVEHTWLQRPARPEDFPVQHEPKWLIAATIKNDICEDCGDELDSDEDDTCDECQRYDNRMNAVDNEHKGRE